MSSDSQHVQGLPSADNWNAFWGANKTSRFTKLSWSKRRIMKILDRHLRPGMKVLDAGCGSGFFSNYFISRGCETFTLDYSNDALEIARRLTNGQSAAYLKEDLLNISFGHKYSQAFDLIFTDGLLEHFSKQDQDVILNNFSLALQPGGKVVTFVPNKYSWWEVVRPLFMPGIVEFPFTMSRLLGKHKGLEIIESGGINVLPVRLSPDQLLGHRMGMLLFCIGRKS